MLCYCVMMTDILDVSPNNGSTEGGTNISITVNAPLANYSMEDIKVLVGGTFTITIPCIQCCDCLQHTQECRVGTSMLLRVERVNLLSDV